MSQPLLSVVIPTRQRHDTLIYAMTSVLEQNFENLELIVMDNCSSPETAEVVSSFNDSRISYYRSSQGLSMTENWELGLSYATGRYVSILGDDDAFVPNAFELCESLIDLYNLKIISWQPSLYTWPSFIAPWRRDQLSIELNQSASILNSKFILRQVYDGQSVYANLPMLYNSFVHESIIDSIKSLYGKYFLSSCPDVYSGIVNAYFSEDYLFSVRPFSIAGASHHSTGSSFAYREIKEANLKVNQFLAEVKEHDFYNIHPKLIPADNLEIAIANVLLHTKDNFFPEDESIQLNIFNLLQSIADNINRDSSAYEKNLDYIQTLAMKHDISIYDLKIPQKIDQQTRNTPFQGMVERESGFIGLVVNCKQVGIENVLQASKLVQAILPNNDLFLDVCINSINSDKSHQDVNVPEILDLKKINLITFPDWQASTQLITTELTSVIRSIIVHPLSSEMSLLVYVDDQDDLQSVDEIISNVLFQIFLDKELQLSCENEPSICVLQRLNESEWLNLAPSLCGIISLANENRSALNQIHTYHQRSGKLAVNQIKDLSLLMC